MRVYLRPNGLPFSRWLEGITFIDPESLFPLPDAKIAPIQPVGCTRLLGRTANDAFLCRKLTLFIRICRLLCGQFGFDFAPDHIERNPPLRRLVGRSFIKESLEGDTVP